MIAYAFSTQIKKYRKEHHMSQAELAEKIGASPHTIYAWEQNIRYPRIDSVYDVANKLGISIRDLVPGEDEQ